MATRFGGAQGRSDNESQKKFLQLIMIVVVLLLAYLIIKAVGGNSQPPVVAQAPQQPISNTPVEEEVSPTVIDIAVAKVRIEEGVQITDDMITSIPKSASRIQGGTILYADRYQDLITKWSTKLIAPRMPVLSSDVSDTRPVQEIIIPPGYRAIAITVDSRSAVEGWAKPNSRVDVLWTFVDTKDRRKKVHTLVRFVKILSVGGQTNSAKSAVDDRGTNVTLLVSEEDARKVELARTLGTLSLTLVGNKQNPAINEPGVSKTVTIDDILGNNKGDGFADIKEDYEGEMYSEDENGRRVRWVLVNGRWKRASD